MTLYSFTYLIVITILSMMSFIDTYLIMNINDNSKTNLIPKNSKVIIENKSSELLSKGSSLILPIIGLSNFKLRSANAVDDNNIDTTTVVNNKKEDSLSFDDYVSKLPLGKDAYSSLGTKENKLYFCKLLNGMWQVYNQFIIK